MDGKIDGPEHLDRTDKMDKTDRAEGANSRGKYIYIMRRNCPGNSLEK